MTESRAETPTNKGALQWRGQQLESIAEKSSSAKTAEFRREYVARETWLRRWVPGRMSGASPDDSLEAELVDEPELKTLDRPAGVDSATWKNLIEQQECLIALDTDEDRKTNLPEIIELSAAQNADRSLTATLPSRDKLVTPYQWTLAYTRYRQGRALAYRELPVVKERWPIQDFERYQQQLKTAYRRLKDISGSDRPEFILLDDRMLRRSGMKGLALELLETNRRWIESKWYLKKRRDLLKELGWDPPFHEAARLYAEAGYTD